MQIFSYDLRQNLGEKVQKYALNFKGTFRFITDCIPVADLMDLKNLLSQIPPLHQHHTCSQQLGVKSTARHLDAEKSNTQSIDFNAHHKARFLALSALSSSLL